MISSSFYLCGSGRPLRYLTTRVRYGRTFFKKSHTLLLLNFSTPGRTAVCVHYAVSYSSYTYVYSCSCIHRLGYTAVEYSCTIDLNLVPRYSCVHCSVQSAVHGLVHRGAVHTAPAVPVLYTWLAKSMTKYIFISRPFNGAQTRGLLKSGKMEFRTRFMLNF